MKVNIKRKEMNGVNENSYKGFRGDEMFKIAICDDENSVCTEIDSIIQDYGRQHLIEFETEIFFSGEILKNHLREERFDIIFLDIELSGAGGVEIGQFVRHQMEDEITQIVFISSKAKYAMELFKVRPLDFFLKPISEKRLREALTEAIRLINRGNQLFEYSVGKTIHRIPYKEILYFKSEGKKIKIVFANEVREFYGKLKHVIKRMESQEFLYIHKSYLVNPNYVAEYKYDFVKMTNNEILSISQANRKNIRDILRIQGSRGFCY